MVHLRSSLPNFWGHCVPWPRVWDCGAGGAQERDQAARWGSPMAQAPALTTTGRKSGEPRKTPLLYLRDGDDIVMVASKGGMTTMPLWYRNLDADPQVQIQIGTSKQYYRARDADDAEAQRLWPALDDMYSGYAGYRARVAGKRRVPVVIFTPEECAPG